MSLLDFFYRIIVYPLELIFEIVFSISERIFSNPGISIFVLSVAVNLLCLPLYHRADIMQAEARDKDQAMKRWTKHIKQTFTGNERFMMLQHYYKLENYSPINSLKSSIPLLLQVPFFIAAYHFLSNLHYLRGVKVGPINDLSMADGLLTVGPIAINILPILMTLINIVSGLIYAKNLSNKDKVQMMGLALVFLVLLYKSPSGLVLYWTFNNVFSLFKNIISVNLNKSNRVSKVKETILTKNDKLIYLFSSISLAVFTGFTLPSETVGRGPTDIIILSNYVSPITLVFYALAVSIGVFIVWSGVFYILADNRVKKIMGMIYSAILLVSVYNAFILQREDTVISDTFANESGNVFTTKDYVINTIIVAAIVIVGYLIWKFCQNAYPLIIGIVTVSLFVYGGYSFYQIWQEVEGEYYLGEGYVEPANITLSTEGQNVVILMLDKGIGCYYPYIMNNDTDLYSSFSGFTYYPNAISYGRNTIFGVPALCGGPEYSVTAVNENAEVSMEDKMNQALLSMPIVFSSNGYNTVVANPPFAGYKWIPDLSIYDEYDVDASLTKGYFGYTDTDFEAQSESFVIRQERNLFCYGLSRCIPLAAEGIFSDSGNFFAIEYGNLSPEEVDSYNIRFFESYTSLNSLAAMTTITEDTSDNFIMLFNESTHEPTRLTEDSYPNGLTDWDGKVLSFENENSIESYQVNLASYEAVGRWLDYLRDNNVYDNTRIIIVSDHGNGIGHNPNWVIGDNLDLMSINCIMLIKEFECSENNINPMFITNAAVPYFATRGLIDNAANPFTGTEYSLDYLSETQNILFSSNFNANQNPGNQYAEGRWYTVVGENYDEFNLIPINAPG